MCVCVRARVCTCYIKDKNTRNPFEGCVCVREGCYSENPCCILPPPHRFVYPPFVPARVLLFITNPPSEKHRRESERQKWRAAEAL